MGLDLVVALGETVHIDNDITVRVREIEGDSRVKITIDAPPSICVDRASVRKARVRGITNEYAGRVPQRE